MKAKPGELPQLLKKGLAPVYLVSGDEPLLVQECCDQIRQAAKDAGFADRITFHADNHFDWNRLGEELGAMSLFAEKRRIEVQLPGGKLGNGRDLMEQTLASPPEDTVLLIISARLDAAETRRKWYKALQGKGVHIPVWPIELDQFPQWLQQRAGARGLTLTRGALQMLVERLEGNLLAASQEIQRLALLSGDGTVDEETVEQAVQDSSRFNIFELGTELLQGRTAHARKIISVLQQEGENPLGFLSVFTRDLGLALELRQAIAKREAGNGFLKQKGVFQLQRAKAIESAARRLGTGQLQQALCLCSDADRAAKGFGGTGPWHHLNDLATLLGTRH